MHRYLGNFKQAITDFDCAEELDNTDTFVLSRRAAVYRVLGQDYAAKADLDKSMALLPETGPDYYNRGVAYVMLGRYEEGIALLQKAAEMEPTARFYAMRDDLLDPIRDRPDFQALLRGPADSAASPQSPISQPESPEAATSSQSPIANDPEDNTSGQS